MIGRMKGESEEEEEERCGTRLRQSHLVVPFSRHFPVDHEHCTNGDAPFTCTLARLFDGHFL